jgi:putative ABC transport system permease protein
VLKFLYLILKNLGRNKLRTTLTALAVAVLVTICAEMLAVLNSVENRVASDASQAKLIVSDRWVMPSNIPVSVAMEVSRLEGVEDWTTWNIYGGFFDESRQKSQEGIGLATRVDNLCAMHNGLENLDPAILDAMKREKNSALMGASIMETMGWKVGQQFTFLSSTHPGKNLLFKVVGVMPPGQWPRNFFFRQDYFEEGTGNKDTVNCLWLRAHSPSAAQALASDIQLKRGKRQPELKVETESAGVARFASRIEAVLGLIKLVVAVLLVDMVVVLSNSISVATRERRVEMAVLKVLGFQPTLIMGLVIGEATLIGAISGMFGAGLAWSCSALTLHGAMPVKPVAELCLMFPIPVKTVGLGIFLGALVGFLGSVFPAWTARKVKVSDVFAKIA